MSFPFGVQINYTVSPCRSLYKFGASLNVSENEFSNLEAVMFLFKSDNECKEMWEKNIQPEILSKFLNKDASCCRRKQSLRTKQPVLSSTISKWYSRVFSAFFLREVIFLINFEGY